MTLVAVLSAPAPGSPASSVNAAAAPPELVIDATRRDFGEVFVGEELTHVFNVRNVGTTPLQLAEKSLTSQSFAPSTAALIGAGSHASHNAIVNYLRPAAAIRRVAAPT